MQRPLTASQWTTVLEWCDANLGHERLEVAVQHFAQPENGGYDLKKGTLLKRWKEWEEAKGTGQDPVFKIKPPTLTDGDWARVFEYMDDHPKYTLTRTAEHFEREEGLKFHRSSLGVKLKNRDAIERRAQLANAVKGKGKAQLPPAKKPEGRRENSREGSTPSPPAALSAGPSRMPVLKTYSSRLPRKAKKNISLKEPEDESNPPRLPASQWLKIFQFADKNPSMNKAEVSRHFAARGINFQSGTLRRKLRERAAAERLAPEGAKKVNKVKQGPSSEKAEVKPPKTLSFSSQRWSNRLAKAPPSPSPTSNVTQLGSASSSFSDKGDAVRSRGEDDGGGSEDEGNEDGGEDEDDEGGSEEEVRVKGEEGEEEEDDEDEDGEESEADDDDESVKVGQDEDMVISDNDVLTPPPESPPRPRSSPLGDTVMTATTATPISHLLISPGPLRALSPSLEDDNAAPTDSAATDRASDVTDDMDTWSEPLEEEATVLSAPPRFKRKRTYHANTSHPGSSVEREPDEKRARLRASTECDSVSTPSLSISSLPAVSESSTSTRSTPMSPSESHTDLPDSSHIDAASVTDVKGEEFLDLPSISCSVSSRDSQPKESLSLRSRLWDAWLP